MQEQLPRSIFRSQEGEEDQKKVRWAALRQLRFTSEGGGAAHR